MIVDCLLKSFIKYKCQHFLVAVSQMWGFATLLLFYITVKTKQQVWRNHFSSYWTDQSTPPHLLKVVIASVFQTHPGRHVSRVLLFWVDKTSPELKETVTTALNNRFTYWLDFDICRLPEGFLWLTYITLRCSGCMSFISIVLHFCLQTTSRMLANWKVIILNTYEWHHSCYKQTKFIEYS